MRKRIAIAIVACAALSGAVAHVQAACPPAGTSKAKMLALKESGFVVEENKDRNTLAVALIDCLANADPQWRDEIAYEALTAWMRGKRLTVESLMTIHDRLAAQLAATAVDKAGFRQPFAALVLAGIVAADREKRFLDAGKYADLVETAAEYFESVRDYRGFDARTGWRHAIAHGADLLTQLAVHPRTHRDEVDRIYEKLTALGHKSSQPPFDAFWGGRYAIVEDPDGNHIGLISQSEPSRRSPPPDI